MRGAQLWLDTSSVNAAIVNTYKSAVERYFGSLGNKSDNNQTESISYDGYNGQSAGPAFICRTSPVAMGKAVKNQAELEGMCSSHLR